MTDFLQPILASKAFQFASLVTGILSFLLAVALVFWLFRDARRRGAHELIWVGVGAAASLIGALIGFAQTKFGFASVGLCALLFVLLTLIIFMFLRPSEYLVDIQERELSLRLLEAELDVQACPSCGSGIEVDFLICPSCNITLRRPCEYCARPINPKWKTCPYCKAHQTENGTSAPASHKKRGARSGRQTAQRVDLNEEDAVPKSTPKPTARSRTASRKSK